MHTIGGYITGLKGSISLMNQSGEVLTKTSNTGATIGFTFITKVPQGFPYVVLKSSNSPSQTCTVSNNVSFMGSSDVKNVNVACSNKTFTLGGTITGFFKNTGTLVLKNNGTNALQITGSYNGTQTFKFTQPIAYNGAYTVTASGPGNGITCTVTNPHADQVKAPIPAINVKCNGLAYKIGGTISYNPPGIPVNGLVLRNNNTDDLPIPALATTFTFKTMIAKGASYTVSVAQQPNGITCTLSENYSKTNLSATVNNVKVVCSDQAFPVILQFINPPSGSYSFDINGTTLNFTPDPGNPNPSVASPPMALSSHYKVTLKGQPQGANCTLDQNSSGVIAPGGPIVQVNCGGGSGSGIPTGNVYISTMEGSNLILQICHLTPELAIKNCTPVSIVPKLTPANIKFNLTGDRVALQGVKLALNIKFDLAQQQLTDVIDRKDIDQASSETVTNVFFDSQQYQKLYYIIQTPQQPAHAFVCHVDGSCLEEPAITARINSIAGIQPIQSIEMMNINGVNVLFFIVQHQLFTCNLNMSPDSCSSLLNYEPKTNMTTGPGKIYFIQEGAQRELFNCSITNPDSTGMQCDSMILPSNNAISSIKAYNDMIYVGYSIGKIDICNVIANQCNPAYLSPPNTSVNDIGIVPSP